MRRLLITLCAGCLMLSCSFALANEGGAYQRTRSHSGGHHSGGFYRGGGVGYPGFWGPGFWYNPPIVVGSYYQRPYPTHLDYFRLRQRTPLVVPQASCPGCELPNYVEPVQ